MLSCTLFFAATLLLGEGFLRYASALQPPTPILLMYWVDSSCTPNKPQFQKGLDEALLIARRGSERLSSTTDTLLAGYFQRIFSQASDTPAADQVNQFLFSIASLEKTDSLAQSNIRFYWDNDPFGPNKRWTLFPDRHNDPDPNFQRAVGSGQERQDLSNGMRAEDDNGFQKIMTGRSFAFAATFLTRIYGSAGNGQNPRRATICDLALGGWVSLRDFPDVDRLSQVGTVNEMSQLLSVTIVHELFHAMQFTSPVRDVVISPAGPGGTGTFTRYGWANLQLVALGDCLSNADNYSFFAFLARLGDRGFRLVADAAGAAAGNIVYDRPSITYRSRMRRLV